MADKKNKPNVKRINSLLNSINTQMNRLYRNTYYSDNTNTKELNAISNDIESNIHDIINRNKDMDVSGITKLYSRTKLSNAVGDTKFNDAIKELFENNPLTDELLVNYAGNKWIKELDNEIDVVLKYCTKLEEALDLMRDAVLSSDSFSKNYLNAYLVSSDDSEQSVFDQRLQNIIKKYKIQDKTKDWYDETSRHGEQFVYVVPYKKAIAKLLNNKKNTRTGPSSLGIMSINTESAIKDSDYTPTYSSTFSDDKNSLQIEFDNSRMLSSCIEESKVIHNIIQEGCKISSLREEYLTEASILKTGSGYKKKELDDTIPDDLELPKEFNSYASDGFVNRNHREEVTPNDLKIKGCVTKPLKRENLIPLFVDDDICLGYYYFEFDMMDSMAFDFYSTTPNYSSGNISQATETISKTTADVTSDNQIDNLIRRISSTISAEIDKKFVNANQDLSKEIYAMLKYNDVYNNKNLHHIKISFLPDEDVHRLAFKIDPDTHRGVSDVLKGLIPAKLFSCLYITNVTGILTRGQDKRVYYVKQTVESNISQTLLNVINQIKKSNFGIRQINNLNNILNITGRFNDFVIPVGQSGDSPIQFEIMPGQDFNINDDLYNMLEEMAVNSTGVPLEMVQSRNSPDFATQFTSSSIKVLRTVFSRQSTCEDFLSKLVTDIYNYEYDTNIELKVELPPPIMLNINNNSHIIQNTKDYVTQIAEYEFEGNNSETADQEKAIFIKRMIRTLLASYVKLSTVDRCLEQSKIEVQKLKEPNNQ